MHKRWAILMIISSMAVWPLTQAFAAEVRMFPPPPPLKSPIEGAIDFHVHSAPDVFGRSIDDIEVAKAAAREGMRAIVLKNHITSTADRAAIVTKEVPGIEVFGGIVLNQAVGGINPSAVEWMYRMSGGRGKVVWMPTFDADHHMKMFKEPGDGIRAAKNGKLLPETEAVLKIIARENLVLQTGHLSPEEILLIIKTAKELGVKNIAVTHAMADVPGMSLAQMKEAAAMGAYMELDFLNSMMGPHAHMGWMQHWKQITFGDMAKAIKAVGAQHFILATDLGQTGNPIHPDGYKLLVAGLKKEGVSQDELDLMMKENPAKLLGLDH